MKNVRRRATLGLAASGAAAVAIVATGADQDRAISDQELKQRLGVENSDELRRQGPDCVDIDVSEALQGPLIKDSSLGLVRACVELLAGRRQDRNDLERFFNLRHAFAVATVEVIKQPEDPALTVQAYVSGLTVAHGLITETIAKSQPPASAVTNGVTCAGPRPLSANGLVNVQLYNEARLLRSGTAQVAADPIDRPDQGLCR